MIEFETPEFELPQMASGEQDIKKLWELSLRRLNK